MQKSTSMSVNDRESQICRHKKYYFIHADYTTTEIQVGMRRVGTVRDQVDSLYNSYIVHIIYGDETCSHFYGV